MKFGILRLRTSYTALTLAQSSAAAENPNSAVSFIIKTSRSLICVGGSLSAPQALVAESDSGRYLASNGGEYRAGGAANSGYPGYGSQGDQRCNQCVLDNILAAFIMQQGQQIFL